MNSDPVEESLRIEMYAPPRTNTAGRRKSRSRGGSDVTGNSRRHPRRSRNDSDTTSSLTSSRNNSDTLIIGSIHTVVSAGVSIPTTPRGAGAGLLPALVVVSDSHVAANPQSMPPALSREGQSQGTSHSVRFALNEDSGMHGRGHNA